MSTEGLPYLLADKTGNLTGSEFDDIYDRMFLRTSSSPSSGPLPSPTGSSPVSSRSSSSSSIYAPKRPSPLSHSSSTSSSLSSSPRSDLGEPWSSVDSGMGMQTLIYELSHRSTRAERAHPERFNMGDGSGPSIVLDFGPGGSLGTVTFVNKGHSQNQNTPTRPGANGRIGMKTVTTVTMSSWLKRSAMFARSLSRKFQSTDGREFKWEFRPQSMPQYEWACTSSEGFLVAHYVLNPQGQPVYRTSGNMLTIYEEFTPVAVELLASLVIMRHIERHNL